MSHIFISYSRKDLTFAEKIVDALAADGLDTWIDWKSIPKGEDWWEHIQQGIEEAEAFLFLVSPASILSDVCRDEIEHAVMNGKRILPIVIEDVSPGDSHPEISRRNWIFCRADEDHFDNAIKETIETIKTDYAWLEFHTGLQVKALEWKRTDDVARLLRGNELQEAEGYLSKVTSDTDPLPTPLQREFIAASQKDEKARGRRTTIFSSTFIIVSIIMCCAVCLAAVGGYVLLDRTPDQVTTEGSILEVRNRSGFRFLQEEVGSTIANHSEPIELTPRSGYVIVVGTGPDGERPGTILAYDMRGNIRWEYQANFDPYEGPTANFSIRHITIDEVMNNGEKQIIFTTQKSDWYPSELVLLSADGKVISSYWNSGFIYNVIPQDFDGDGIKELVVSAVNNNLGILVVNDATKHPVTVYILSPKDDFTGQTYPDLIPGIPSGTEYNHWIAVLEPYTVTGIDVRIVQAREENLIEVVYNEKGGYINLDKYGRIGEVGISDFWRSEYPETSPVEFICFLQSENDDWYFPPRVDEGGFCPWYVRE